MSMRKSNYDLISSKLFQKMNPESFLLQEQINKFCLDNRQEKLKHFKRNGLLILIHSQILPLDFQRNPADNND